MKNDIANTSIITKQIESSRLELLDMGLRGNPQLNCRSGSQKVLDIVDEKSSEIFKLIVNKEASMSFLPIPKVYQKKKAQEEKSGTLTFQEEDLTQLPPLDVYLEEKTGESRFSDKNLQTGLIPEKLDKSLLKIENEAHSLLQEQGIEVLYLALGFLKWYEDERSNTARYAPLFLVPVELLRTSAKESFKLKYTGEELGPNLTLSAKLKGEFNITLPLFDDNIDPAGYFKKVRDSVAKQKSWQVLEDKICLSLFSFGKFQMYMDLDTNSWPDNKKPTQNTLLKKLLIEGFGESHQVVENAHHHDVLHSPEKLALVKDADSSQLEAIAAVKEGADLVLQGPPGTGKSQTITNIIAESLGQGKKILFVAQKMAALEVVKKRLDESHLGSAVLELHSHKSTRKNVLASIAKSLEQGKPNIPDRDAEYQRLCAVKNELTAYATAVSNKILNSELNFVEALGRLKVVEEQLNEEIVTSFTCKNISEWSPGIFEQIKDKLNAFILHLDEMGVPEDNPFRMTNRQDLSPADQTLIAVSAAKCIQILSELQMQSSDLAAQIGFAKPNDLTGIEKLHQTIAQLLTAPEVENINIRSKVWKLEKDRLQEFFNIGVSLTKMKAKHSDLFLDQIYNANLMEIRAGLNGRTDKWWRVLSSDFRNAKKTLSSYSKMPLPNTPSQWLTWVDELLETKKLETTLKEHSAMLSDLFGHHFKGENTNWEHVKNIANWLVQLYQDIANDKVDKQTIDYLGKIDVSQGLSERLNSNKKLFDEFQAEKARVFQQVDIKQSHMDDLQSESCFEKLSTLFTGWQNVDGLYQYARFNKLCNELMEFDLGSLIAISKSWRKENHLLWLFVQQKYYDSLVAFAYQQFSEIKQFDRVNYETLISTFIEKDLNCLGYAQESLAEHIFNLLPKRHAKGEMELLMRELGKKNRHIPIRQLIAKTSNAIQQIKPIFMMSPMSISTFLKQGTIDFDLVIFDEASQIKAPDSLGALLRGKQVVVVGDSKQMPPTDLFGKSVQLADEEVDDSSTAEMESLLSMMESKGVPQIMLSWHYRSRHDSLIAVSNNQFYDGKLLAFPAPGTNKEARGLRFHYLPDNLYGEDGAGANWGEAQAIAYAVMQHAKCSPKLSLGVVAFGSAQRDLINLEIEKLRRETPETEAFFQHHEGGDEFFVKNLENVQGDERDVIFISVCYGKKRDGKINQNFGPLNKNGGERRLNVLISRARLAMEVFCNFKGEELRVSDDSPFGLKSLQAFLQFAENRKFEHTSAPTNSRDDPLLEQIGEAITQAGYSIQRAVGNQGYQLDIGIHDPNNKEQYLLAIETDGAQYHSATSVRERERLRTSVLSGLGWQLHRVWSPNWYRNKQAEIERLNLAIENAVQLHKELESMANEKNLATTRSIQPTPEKSALSAVKIEREKPEVHDQKSFAPQYKMVSDSELGLPKVDDFGGIPTTTLINAIIVLVNTEAPIMYSLVTPRMAAAAGLARAGARVKRQVENAIEQAINERRVISKNGALWSADQGSVSLRSWEFLPDNIRKLDNVCDDEISNSLLLTVQDAYTIDDVDAISACLASLGFRRVTAQSSKRVEAIIEQQIKKGRLSRENGRLKINSTS